MTVIRTVSNFLYFFHDKISKVQKSTKRYRDNSVFKLVPLNTQTFVYLYMHLRI